MTAALSALTALFQLVVSAAFSFAGALLLVALIARALRLSDGRTRLAVLLLPFAKLALEVGRGIPANAFFWLKTQGARQELGGFRFGVGVDRISPRIDLSLSARWLGAEHPQSAADLFVTLLVRRIHVHAPAAIAAALVIGALFLGAHALFARRRAARENVLADTTVTGLRSIGRRTVTIATSPSWKGVPFVMGLLEPVVVVPERVAAALSPEENEAVIQHELGHIRGLHIVIVSIAGLFARAFWFVPGVRYLAREIRTQCEVCADDAAIRAGVAPEILASAVVRVGETVLPLAPPAALALFERPSVLGRRVRRLLAAGPARPARPARWTGALVRCVALAVLAATVLRTTTFGNP